MFNKEYEVNKILDNLNSRGYYVIDGFLKDAFISGIFEEIGNLDFSFNKNSIPSVIWKNQRYLTHMLAKSKSIYND